MHRQLEIATMNQCINNCSVCPQDTYKAAYKGKAMLSYEDFVGALAHVPKTVEIVFSGFCEPFLNRECIKMIEYASQQGYTVELYTTLVGMTPEEVERLSKCRISRLFLHLPDNKGIAKIPVTERYIKVLMLAFQKLHFSYIMTMGTGFSSNGRAGNDKNVKEFHLKGMFGCRKLSTPHFVMLPNCDATLCCMDYGLKHVVGNLLKSSYEELMNSPARRKVLDNRYKSDGDVLCRSCTLAEPILKYAISATKIRLFDAIPTKYLPGPYRTFYRPIPSEPQI